MRLWVSFISLEPRYCPKFQRSGGREIQSVKRLSIAKGYLGLFPFLPTDIQFTLNQISFFIIRGTLNSNFRLYYFSCWFCYIYISYGNKSKGSVLLIGAKLFKSMPFILFCFLLFCSSQPSLAEFEIFNENNINNSPRCIKIKSMQLNTQLQ